MQVAEQAVTQRARLVLRLCLILAVLWTVYVAFYAASDLYEWATRPGFGWAHVVDPPGWMINTVFVWKALLKPWLRSVLELLIAILSVCGLYYRMVRQRVFVYVAWTAVAAWLLFFLVDSASGVLLANSPRSRLPAGPVDRQLLGVTAPNRLIQYQSQQRKSVSWLGHTNKNLLEALRMAVPLPFLLVAAFVHVRGRDECRTCGYSLAGLTSNRCPECGTVGA